MKEELCAGIFGDVWRVKFNPEGGGLMLCVDRGIPCEGHTQVFSAHVTNNPDWSDVVAELQDKRYKEQIDNFVTLMQSMGQEWHTKEAMGAVFCTALIKRIAENAEKRMYDREAKKVS
jgi:hypothetical protein